VDTETEAQIHAALQRLATGRTTFIIAHRIQTVMRADRILVLDNGRIIQQGTHADLLLQDGIYRKIYDLQARVEDDVLPVNGKGERITAPVSNVYRQ
jgi:ATP-binding cassette subfamily B protein